MISWRIKKVVKKTKTYFEGYYKDHRIVVQWTDIGKKWIIVVTMIKENEPMVYRGFWGNKNYDIDDAIYEAMRGSGLI